MKPGFLSCLCALWLLACPVQAQVVEIRLPSGNSALAEYASGEEGAVPVLLLHGFLQTHNFFTVKRLHDALAEAGYTVLSPTLSLGIHKRSQSLDCEALHLHDLDSDVAELGHWVDWLHQRHGRPLVMISHSAGGQVMTRYLHEQQDAPVVRAVLISLSHPQGIRRGPVQGPMGEYRLGFCDKYVTTPQAYQSYVDWGAEQMHAAMLGYAHPVSVILGSGDDRISPFWRKVLEESRVEVKNIEGASHFFDNADEFELLDAVEGILEGI